MFHTPGVLHNVTVSSFMQDLDRYAPEPEVHKYLHSR